jgi:hypothetical protein
MILIDESRELNLDEKNAAEFLKAFHFVSVLPTEKIFDECDKARLQVYDSVYQHNEPELKELRDILPKRKHFKLNCKPLLAWQKKQKGFVRPAFGFSDVKQSRKAFKKAGFIVGKMPDLLKLQAKMEGIG